MVHSSCSRDRMASRPEVGPTPSAPAGAPSTMEVVQSSNAGPTRPGSPATIPLLPSGPPGSPETTPRIGAEAAPQSRVLTLLVLLFAFLLGSFPARNADAWMHLAAGRRLAQGEFAFGPDARAASELSGSSSWLYDLVSYGL